MNNRKTYEIKGAHCGACIEMIKKTLTAVKGVTDTHVNFDEKKITLDVTEEYDENAAIEAIAQEGYQLQVT